MVQLEDAAQSRDRAAILLARAYLGLQVTPCFPRAAQRNPGYPLDLGPGTAAALATSMSTRHEQFETIAPGELNDVGGGAQTVAGQSSSSSATMQMLQQLMSSLSTMGQQNQGMDPMSMMMMMMMMGGGGGGGGAAPPDQPRYINIHISRDGQVY